MLQQEENSVIHHGMVLSTKQRINVCRGYRHFATILLGTSQPAKL